MNMFKFNNKDTRTTLINIASAAAIFISNFEQYYVFLLLTLYVIL